MFANPYDQISPAEKALEQAGVLLVFNVVSLVIGIKAIRNRGWTRSGTLIKVAVLADLAWGPFIFTVLAVSALCEGP